MFDRRKANHKAVFYLTVALVGSGFLAVPLMQSMPTKLVWNASESVPKGLYRITGRTAVKGDLVLVRLPKWAAFLANQRGYLPRNTPVLKRISAVHGDVVCRFSGRVFINQVPVATVNNVDRRGRKVPQWSGCRRLHAGEVFLLADHPNSFDGRYFGITKLNQIIGSAEPLWLITD